MSSRPTSHPVAARALRALLALGLVGGLLAPAAARAETVAPRLKLIPPTGDVVVQKYGREPVYLDLGVRLAALGAPFEIRGVRPDYTQPIQALQVIYAEDGTSVQVPLPSDVLPSWSGLEDFFELNVTNRDGVAVAASTLPFCPGGWGRERVNDDGPARPIYPDSCWANALTKGMVWGIEKNWAASIMSYDGNGMMLRRGRYTATVEIADTYRDLFGIAAEDAAVSVALRVKRIEDDCGDCPVPVHGRTRRAAAQPPDLDAPDPALLPDLQSLPAWGMNVEERRRGTFLSFGATVWTGGNASLIVEGFRRDNEAVMDAYQYFYEDGEVVGRAAVGTMEYDERRGHTHWHFLQFARYSLLDATQTEILRSKKEAFCLAPTDAIDLNLPNAEWQPGAIGLGTACGGPSSIWVREVLPLGWGDTYFQGLPGQSFNITNLPNGTYYIAVEANPLKTLHEVSTDNNVELREIRLKGRPGARRVVVPPWNGIDTETGHEVGHG